MNSSEYSRSDWNREEKSKEEPSQSAKPVRFSLKKLFSKAPYSSCDAKHEYV